MASDEYSTAGGGGGALKLKGAKVHKKKKKRDKTDLEKNLATGTTKAVVKKGNAPEENEEKSTANNENDNGIDSGDDAPTMQKTEAEKRHAEIKRKRLLQMAEDSGARPGLLKTHKERVEELNTYLSKLSEHHDMPKIGPG
ncbi:hypothetical protein G7046_g9511 [Stylonectria norvegica]|nr:hypothetical protein G7046_g9511 [Stylonectria norvegica]